MEELETHWVPPLAPLVFDHAVIVESRAQYVILDIGNFKVRLCLFNVYAPNLPTPRHHVWIELGKLGELS